MTFINATQFSGMASFGSAAICSAVNWRAARPGKRQWAMMSIIAALLAAECWMGLRHRVHGLATDWLVMRNLYGARTIPQEYLITALAIAGCAVLLFIVTRSGKRSGACRAAWFATILSLGLFLIETVSLHSLDALFYRPLGPVAVIGWLWILLGLLVSLSARTESRCPGT